MRFCEVCGAAFQSLRSCPRDRIAARADLEDPMLGRVLADRYRVLDRVAAGGMGIVYRAAHARIASLFALKVLYGDIAHDAEMRARFQREAEAASCLHSRHVVRVVDFGETAEGLPYLAMELVQGASLASVIAREGKLTEPRAVRIAKQLARGLAHAHERGIVHRDLKPDNVMMADEDDDEPVAKILDFGLASATHGAKLTRAGQIFGTPQYMAPEQFLGADSDARADLYALGVMLYEMVAGAPPFDAPSLGELAAKHAGAAPPPLATGSPKSSVSAAYTRLVERLLQKRAADRFGSARAVLEALRAIDAPPPSVSAAPRAAAVPAAAAERIVAAIQAGAPAYNAGDHAGCLRVYRQTAERLLAEVLDPASAIAAGARLRLALARASRAASPSHGAWEMRYAFDDLLHAAASPAPAAGDRVAAELAIAELVMTPRQGAGHVDLAADYAAAVASELSGALARDGSHPALRSHLDRVASGARSSGGPRALAYLRDSLEVTRSGGEPAAASMPAPPPSLAAGCPDIDRVADALVRAIAAGAPAYNAGDIEGCRRLYAQTARGVVAQLGPEARHLPLVARLSRALDEASRLPVDRAAWALRHAFDDILAAVPRR
jgi:hypothetical protein